MRSTGFAGLDGRPLERYLEIDTSSLIDVDVFVDKHLNNAAIRFLFKRD